MTNLEGGAHARDLIVAYLRELWDAIWTSTRSAGDRVLRDQRFEAWLAEPEQQQLIADRLALGGMWRGGRWMVFAGSTDATTAMVTAEEEALAETRGGASQDTKCITWRDDAGVMHFHDDAPVDALCLDPGARCPLNSTEGGKFHVGTVLAIGSSTFVCCTCITLGVYSSVEHLLPDRIITLTEDRLGYRVTRIRDEVVSPSKVKPCSTCGKPGCRPMEHAGWDPTRDPQQ